MKNKEYEVVGNTSLMKDTRSDDFRTFLEKNADGDWWLICKLVLVYMDSKHNFLWVLLFEMVVAWNLFLTESFLVVLVCLFMMIIYGVAWITYFKRYVYFKKHLKAIWEINSENLILMYRNIDSENVKKMVQIISSANNIYLS